jgi:hypothetical protein
MDAGWMERVMMDQATVELGLRISRGGRSRWTGSMGALGHGLDEWRMGGRGNGCGEIGITFEDR